MVLSNSLVRDLRAVHGVSVDVDASLAAHTTIRTGGCCAALLTVESVAAVVDVLGILRKSGSPFHCLGAGSDLLVADEGYDGVVLRLADTMCATEGLPAPASRLGVDDEAEGPEKAGAPVVVTVGGAAMVKSFAGRAAEAGLAGFEFACGIPGAIGGGVATNAGAYGRAFSDLLTEVQLASDEGARWVQAADLEWEYRNCRLPEEAVVTAARFQLERDDPEAVLDRHRTILDMRAAVQPQGVFTFGSTFKNPSGGAAGRLLDAAGLKGERRGGAEVSKVHANFVVNLGDASTADVLTLMDHMRQRVHETSGVWLEPEVRLLGADFPWRSSAGGARRLPPADG